MEQAVERLKRQLAHGRITKDRFSLPYGKQTAVELIHTAIVAEIEYRRRVPVITQDLLDIENAIADWLVGNGKMSLLLMGNVGDGKTTALLAIRNLVSVAEIEKPYQDNRYSHSYECRYINARSLAEAYASDKAKADVYFNADIVALDDVGAEPAEILTYGNPTNAVADLLFYRYEKMLPTIITTNLKPTEFRPRYGDRIADRMNETFDKIVFPEKSYRTI